MAPPAPPGHDRDFFSDASLQIQDIAAELKSVQEGVIREEFTRQLASVRSDQHQCNTQTDQLQQQLRTQQDRHISLENEAGQKIAYFEDELRASDNARNRLQTDLALAEERGLQQSREGQALLSQIGRLEKDLFNAEARSKRALDEVRRR
jgi:hypothetical protein